MDPQPNQQQTALQRIQASPAFNSQRLLAFFEQSALGKAELDLNGCITVVNRSFSRLLGWDPEEIVGLNLLSFLRASYADQPLGACGAIEKQYVRKDGSCVWLIETVTEICDDSGEVQCYLLSLQDISQRKEAEELTRKVAESAAVQAALKRQSEQLEDAQRLAQLGSWSWDIASGQVLWSPELYRLVGHDPSLPALAYEEQSKIYQGEGWGRLQAAVTEAVIHGTPYELELELTSLAGRKAWAIARGVADRDEQGTIIGLHGTLQDVSARRVIEDALRHALDKAEAAAKSKSEFLATMSHEIRTPMNGVVGMTALLLETELNPEQRNYLETIRSSGEALLALINDILDFSKIEAGKLILERAAFELRAVVEEAIDVVAEMAAQKGLQLQFLLSNELPSIWIGDSLRLRQILLNLLSNAIKFTNRGSVSLVVDWAPGHKLGAEIEGGALDPLRFSVTDTGIGINEAQQQSLFQSFSQVDSSTTRKYGGTGLGLSIAQRLVKMMEGEIGVESEAGQGSTFWFTAKIEASASDLPSSQVDRALQGKRVLLACSDALSLLLATQQIEALGMEPVPLTTFEKLKNLSSYEPERSAPSWSVDVALIDCGLPFEAAELSQQLRRQSGNSSLPLVFLGNGLDQRQRLPLAELEPATYLAKPLRLKQLLPLLAAFFASPLPQQRQAPPDPRTGRILLAEDNRTNQKVASVMLRRLGYSIELAENGLKAVEAVRNGSYDLVLMDCQMPEMDGFQAAASIRNWEVESSAEPKVHIPIVALTANALSGDRERCLAAGMDDYLSKPLDLTKLDETLRRWLPQETDLTATNR